MYDDSFERFRGECLEYNYNKNCNMIEEWCKEAGVTSPVGYYNELEKLIGRGGCLVNKFKKRLCEQFYANEYEVKFVEIRGGFANIE